MAHRGICPDMACQRIEIEKGRQRSELGAVKIVAEELGVSVNTVRAWVYRNRVDANASTLNLEKKYDTCAESDLKALIEKKNKFGTIYADPPWPYSNQATRSATDKNYQTMSLEDIASLPIKELTAEKAHLHLWTTNAFLFECKDIMQSWGFDYKSCFVWVKPQMGIGNYWRLSHEFLLLGVKGGLTFLAKDEKSWLLEDRTTHSTKPSKIRSIIEKVSPGPYLELFARNTFENWTVWGNEIKRTLFNESLLKSY